MILKKTIKTEVEFEVEFPCYRKSIAYCWKLIDENNAIQIDIDSGLKFDKYAGDKSCAPAFALTTTKPVFTNAVATSIW